MCASCARGRTTRSQYRYRVVPDVLEHFESIDLPADENARFWITLRIPEDAPAGNYVGKVTFACAARFGDAAAAVAGPADPLREDPSKIFGIYYRHPYDQMASAPDEVSKEYFRRKAELEHQDMVAHGTRNVVLSVSRPRRRCAGKFQFQLGPARRETRAVEEASDSSGPVVMGIPTGVGLREVHEGAARLASARREGSAG